VLRRLAFPYFRARDEPFERAVDDGVFVGNTTDMLSMYVLAFGVWEPHLSAFMRQRLGPGDVFVDVGANCGWYTLLAARRVGADGTVVAIEPFAPIVERLEQQIARNALTNVRVIPEAVSDHVGRVSIEPGPAQHTGLTRALHESADAASVPCRPLPEMLGDTLWSRVRLVKIDVEGAEFVAIRGLASRLSGLPSDAEIIVEIGPQRAEAPDEVAALFATFEREGYSGYAIPNEYGVKDYLEYVPIAALPLVTAASVTTELNVVFSRLGNDELPVH